MASDVVMPKMGYDMEEGTILRWIKSEGDEVDKGDIIAEIETGKVDIEIEAFDAGVLRAILVEEGETVPVGTPIAIIGGADEEIQIPDKPAAQADEAAAAEAGEKAGTPAEAGDGNGQAPDGATGAADVAEAERAAAEDARAERRARKNGAGGVSAEREKRDLGEAEVDGRLRASPLARRIAEDHDLDIRELAPGSGPHGRVVRDDVEAALEAAEAAPARAPEKRPERERMAAEVPAERQPMSKMRQIIARRLTSSWQEAPHIFLTMAIEMDRAFELRAQINEGLAEVDGGKISLNDLVVKAVARSLQKHPRLNVSWEEGERVVHQRINVGNAVALEDGLITVTVADADQKGVAAIGSELADKAERARSGKLTPEDLETPSTFTVSNLGMYGIEEFTAIINPPEACILAVGAAVATPVAVEGPEGDSNVAIRRVMRVTLSADHRVVDGATAAEFLVTLKKTLENPVLMLA